MLLIAILPMMVYYFMKAVTSSDLHFPSFSLDMNSDWAELTVLIMAVAFCTALLVMIAYKWRNWMTDPENPTVQIKEGMNIFG